MSIVQEMAWKRGRKVGIRWQLRSVEERGIAIARGPVGGVKMGEQDWGRRRELESLWRDHQMETKIGTADGGTI